MTERNNSSSRNRSSQGRPQRKTGQGSGQRRYNKGYSSADSRKERGADRNKRRDWHVDGGKKDYRRSSSGNSGNWREDRRNREDNDRYYGDSRDSRRSSRDGRGGGRDSRDSRRYEQRRGNRYGERDRQDRREGQSYSRRQREFSRNSSRSFSSQRSSFRSRDERAQNTTNDNDRPVFPEWVDPRDLSPEVRREFHTLSRDKSDTLASYLVAALGYAELGDHENTLKNAKAAIDLAGRIGVVRETAGVVAYMIGEWKLALSELRAARRISGGPGLMPLMADCLRALGRPEKALEMVDDTQYLQQLSADDLAEFRIVIAGIHHDNGDHEAAVNYLEQGPLDPSEQGVSRARYFYAYADALQQVGRTEDAVTWFQHAFQADEEGLTDAADRILQLDQSTES